MRYQRFLKTATPEELSSHEASFQRCVSRVRRLFDDGEMFCEPHQQEDRELIIELVAALRLQAADVTRQARIHRYNSKMWEDGANKLADLALKNVANMEYWHKLALAYEMELKSRQ